MLSVFLPLVFILISRLQTTGAQNQAPIFTPRLSSNYFFPEYDTTKPGNILLWLNATDNDDDDLQFGVEGGFYNKLVQVVKVDGKHAKVVAREPFDREVQEKFDDIFFYVQDAPGNKVYQSVRFVILDIDDNQPVFENTPYKIDVFENQDVGSVIFDAIRAYDLDGPLFNEFTFSLNEATAPGDRGLFQMGKTEYVSNGRFRSSITLGRSLDYEKSRSHVVTVTATGMNSAFVTSTELLVSVLDYPDRAPEFSQSPYYVKIEEEMPMGAFVLQVFARDGDYGISNKCKYKIVYDNNQAAEYFQIDSSTGTLTINKRIDLESSHISNMGGLLEFKVIAYEINDESSSTETQVTVAIVDINDNRPEFAMTGYNLQISPDSVDGTSLTLTENSIHVSDLDKGINGSFTLFLIKDKNISEDFEVIPRMALNDANLVIKLKSSNRLMAKMGTVEHYQLIASDNGINGMRTSTDLFIKVEAINRFTPEFASDYYIYYIDENSGFNTTVGMLKAQDNDTTTGEYGRIYYELKNGQNLFEIERSTGRIYTVSRYPEFELDREVLDTFHMSAVAIDGGGLRKSVQVVVKLRDVNDNAPTFISNSLTKSKTASNFSLIGLIEENTSKWTEPIRLQAIDRDNSKNGQVIYEIIDGDYLTDLFMIDTKTNTIQLAPGKTLDFEELVELHTMQKLLKRRSSFLDPMITYDDILLAYDEIDLNLVIKAQDLGEPALHSVIVAKVIVKDINDHTPTFPEKLYSAQVLETARSGHVFQVQAMDFDAPNTPNSEITYRIETGARDKFYIDSASGLVKITENTNLDRDIYGSDYLLRISANNFGKLSPSKNILFNKPISQIASDNDKNRTLPENVCFLKIHILDVNNRSPQFVGNLEVAKVKENVPIGSLVTRVVAEDPDLDHDLRYFFVKGSSEENKNNSLTNLKFQAFDHKQREINVDLVKDWFTIDPKNGTIYTNASLDRELAEQVVLIIGVQDLNATADFPTQIKTTSIRIKIQDINDNYPMFPNGKLINPKFASLNEEPMYEITSRIEENTKPKTKVFTLLARDLDRNARITYKKVYTTELGKDSLEINPRTGEVFVSELIDFEQVQWINLTILAVDNSFPFKKQTILLLNFKIDDLNDNEPTFQQLNTTEFSVAEDSPVNTSIATFLATDLDSPVYGPITYRILSGHEDKFDIDASTGELVLKSKLDREQQDVYTLVIQARDNAGMSRAKRLSDSLLIKVRVLDVNDNRPFCEKRYYSVYVNQNAEVNTGLLDVKGVDLDLGVNAEIQYSLSALNETENALFKIDPKTGRIETNKKLQGHSGTYIYNISLTDSSSESLTQLSGHCLVSILIKEFNGHPPQFLFPNEKNSSIRVKASILMGSPLFQVKALDPDNEIGVVTYEIDQKRTLNNDWKSFSINHTTGVLSLNTKLNINRQSVYLLDIIATDAGRPQTLQSRMTLTLVVVDESNNAVQFDKMEICLSGNYQCDKYFQSLVFSLKEEQTDSTIQIPSAKMNDISKKDDEICYYLSGKDSAIFTFNTTSRTIQPLKNQVLDREKASVYEVVITGSEYCSCQSIESRDMVQCQFLKRPFDQNDLTQIKVQIQLEDINDNRPQFSKRFYQVGITADIEFNEAVLEAYATDLDTTGALRVDIDKSSYVHNLNFETSQLLKSNANFFPFTLKSNVIQETTPFRRTDFQIRTHKYLKKQDFEATPIGRLSGQAPKNKFITFNVTAFDEIPAHNSSAQIQVILLTKQQRVKFVFSQPVSVVIDFQEEFREFISNLTGFTANIDRVYAHKLDADIENYFEYTSQNQVPKLTEMLVHFMRYDVRLTESNDNYILNADAIVKLLDKSNTTELLEKYRLSLAENYDSRGTPNFYKYGAEGSVEATEDKNNYRNVFQWTAMPKNYTQFLVRLLLIAVCVVFVFGGLIALMVCCCMRQKYQKKIKAERALVKAYGLDQRSLNYNDAISGYLNAAFEATSSNSDGLLACPGTNLYAYEGSNPIWLKKYEHIKPASLSGISSSSSSNTESSCLNATKTMSLNKADKTANNNEDISAFYLKQVDNTLSAETSHCSPSETSHCSQNALTPTCHHMTHSSDALSVHDISAQVMNNTTDYNTARKSVDTLLTFATASNNPLRASSKCRNFTQEINILKSQLKSIDGTLDRNETQGSYNHSMSNIVTYGNLDNHTVRAHTIDGKYTKIMENGKNTAGTMRATTLATASQRGKDCADLYEVESTVI